MPLPISPRLALAAALVGAAMLSAPVAHAFTLEDGTGKGQDQSFLYPDRGTATDSKKIQQGFTSKDGVTTYRDGNATFSFGRRPTFNQEYNPDRLFDPLGHPPPN